MAAQEVIKPSNTTADDEARKKLLAQMAQAKQNPAKPATSSFNQLVTEGAPIAANALQNTLANSYTAQYVAKPAQEAVKAFNEGRYGDAVGQTVRGVGGAVLGLASDVGQPFVNAGRAAMQIGGTAFTGENTQPTPAVKPIPAPVLDPSAPRSIYSAPPIPAGLAANRERAIAAGNTPVGVGAQMPATGAGPATNFRSYTPGGKVDETQVPTLPADARGARVIATGNSVNQGRLATPAKFSMSGGAPGQLIEMSSDDPASAAAIGRMNTSLQERGINSLADLERVSAAPKGTAQESAMDKEAAAASARRAEAYDMAKKEFMSAGTDRPEARREALRTMALLSGTDPGTVKGKTALDPLQESQRLENEANTQKLANQNRQDGLAIVAKNYETRGGKLSGEAYASTVFGLSEMSGLPPSKVDELLIGSRLTNEKGMTTEQQNPQYEADFYNKGLTVIMQALEASKQR